MLKVKYQIVNLDKIYFNQKKDIYILMAMLKLYFIV